MEKKIKSYQDLDIWSKGIEIVKDIYTITENFPNHETYGLISQMRRAAVSVPSNIAEDFRRQHNKEFRQFLHITLGSCAELETQVIVSKELGYIQENLREQILEKLEHIYRMISNLIKKL